MSHKPDNTNTWLDISSFIFANLELEIETITNRKSHRTAGLASENETKVNSKRARNNGQEPFI